MVQEALTQADNRPCYVHIGMHKTATTSIQRFFWNRRKELESHGILYPATGCVFWKTQLFGQHNIALELKRDWRFEPEQGTTRELLEELAASGASVAVLSSELFNHLCVDARAIEALVAGIRRAGYLPRVIVYFRARADYALSLYGALVRSQKLERAFREFTHEIVSRGYFQYGGLRYYFRYAEMLKLFEDAFGIDNIIARAFDRQWERERILEDFLSVIDPHQLVERTTLPAERTNEASNFGEILQHLQRNLERTETACVGKGAPPFDDWLQGPFDVFDQGEATAFEEAFSADNAEMLRRYSLRVPLTRLPELDAQERAAKIARRRAYDDLMRQYLGIEKQGGAIPHG